MALIKQTGKTGFSSKKSRLERIVEQESLLKAEFKDELDEVMSGRKIPEKLLGRAATLLKQAERIVENAGGGYPTSVGAKATSGMGSVGLLPATILPLTKRFIAESTFIRDLIDVQVLPAPTGLIFGIRMVDGQFGEGNEILDLSKELNRPYNNRLANGNLKLIFSGDAVDTINNVSVADGSYRAPAMVADGNDKMANVPGNYVAQKTIGNVAAVNWDFPAIVALFKSGINGNNPVRPDLNNALVPQVLAKVDAGAFDTAVEAEMFIRDLALNGIGLRVDYANTLEDYKRELSADPAAGDIYKNIAADVYTATFTGTATNAKFSKITPRVDTENLETESNELFSDWPRKLEDDSAAVLGIDINSIVVEQGKKLMLDSVDRDAFGRMKMVSVDPSKGGTKAKVFNLDGTTATSQIQGGWLQQKITSLVIALNAQSEEVFRSTGRIGRGDFAITTPTVSTMLISAKSMYNDFTISDNRKNNAAELGEIAGITLYSDIWSELVDQGIGTLNRSFAQMIVGMTAKGEGEAGIVLGTYKPVTVYGPVLDPQTMNHSILLETRYGISDTIIDPGAFYRATIVEGIETALYGA